MREMFIIFGNHKIMAFPLLLLGMASGPSNCTSSFSKDLAGKECFGLTAHSQPAPLLPATLTLCELVVGL